jgi:predicted ester cyclase
MSHSSLVEGNKALVRRVIEQVWNNGDMTPLGELMQPGFIHHHERNRDADLHGIEALRSRVLALRKAVPDLRLAIDRIFGENDKVMVHLRGTGTYAGPSRDVATTGTPLTFTATGIVRVADGRLAEAWVITDTLGILQQLGAVQRFG